MDLYQLPSVSVVANANANISLKDLPVQRRGRIPHVTRFIFEMDYIPTTTALPTTVGNNAVVKACDFWDGRVNRFVGGFNEVRAHERINTGQNRFPDADTDLASGSARYVRRVLHVGPPQMAGELSDYMIPTGALQSAELRFTIGALTDIAADCTAVSGTVRTYADLEVADEVRIPPSYQVTKHTLGSADLNIQGRSLLVSMYAFNSATFDAWTAGDLGDITLDAGLGNIVSGIKASVLSAAYADDFGAGEVGVFDGDPRHANDDNGKVVNHASPTAIAAAPHDLQPIVWARPYKKLSKCEVAETALRLSWNGTQGSAVLCVARILPQTPSVVAAIGAAAVGAIGRTMKDLRIKTVSKKVYNGPRGEFMPWVAKV